MAQGEKAGAPKLAKYLTPLGAWALAFGCSVGWGAFVMPGSTFLPVAGPVGTAIGIAISVPIMLVVAINYHYLINRYPDAGGTYAFTKACFDYDHGFVNAWFLILCYVAIIWANATALPLIARNLFGSLFQVGFHYQIAGFDIYFGEVLMAILSLLFAGFLCLHRRVAGWVQIVMALVLLVGAGVCAYLVITRAGATEALVPPFAPDRPEVPGVITIIALAPWAFVGFESICHSSAEFEFSPKRSFRIMAIAVVTAAVAYGALAVLATTARPEGVASWPEYIAGLGSYEGIQNLPTFFAATVHLGNAGYFVLGFMALAGIITK